MAWKEEPLVLSALPPTRRQERLACVVAFGLTLGFLAALLGVHRQLPRVDAFIPIVDTVIFLVDLIVAVLLYAQYSVARASSLLALASGYLLTALLIIPHALTFPGAFSATGLLGATIQSTVWLYIFWHITIPVTAIVYALLKRSGRLQTKTPVKAAIATSICAICLLTATLTLLATSGAEILPKIMLDTVSANSVWSYYAAPPVLALFLASLILMWKRRSSTLDLWLLLVLWAWFIEIVLLSMTSSRYSLVWYAGKVFGLLSSSFVLIVLLSQSTMLHAQLAISVAAEKREREGRRMSMEVMVAALAHELKQPLSAIITNSAAEMRMLVHTPPDWGELRATVEDISRDGRRATEIIESIRSMFSTGSRDRRLLDLNEVVDELLAVLRIELKTHGISLAVESSRVPFVRGNKGQLQQVLSNLITNAIESMATVPNRAHWLRIQSKAQDSTVSLSIQDSGRGIDRESAGRIFEPFFTTKPKGMGLGLAICRSIVESHLGRLSVTPGNPSGCVFRIDLPIATSEKPSDIEREDALAK